MGKLWTRVRYRYLSYTRAFKSLTVLTALGVCYLLYMWLTDTSVADDTHILHGGGTRPKQHMADYEIIAHLRSLKDTRPDHCYVDIHDNLKELQALSVSFILHYNDEEVHNFKLTLTSLVKHTPLSLMKEVIVIDDGSKAETRDTAQAFVARDDFKVVPIRGFRSEKSDGPTLSRLKAALMTESKMLFFINNFVVLNTGWLPPLMNYLIRNPKSAVTPHMDSILDEYRFVPVDPDFITIPTWMLSTVHYKKQTSSENVVMPVMNGKVFGIYKDFYHSLGEYDPELGYQAGNFELGLRVSLCGDKVVKVACSHVASWDVFTPAVIESEVDVFRIAELWFGEDKKEDVYLQREINLPSKTEEELLLGVKSRKSRLTGPHGLKNICHDIAWYSENVCGEEVFNFPSQGWRSLGKIRSSFGRCLYIQTANQNSEVQLGACKPPIYESDFIFEHTLYNRLKVKGMCLVADAFDYIRAVDCSIAGQEHLQRMKWLFEDGGAIRNEEFGLCLEQTSASVNKVVLTKCDSALSTQKWSLIKY